MNGRLEAIWLKRAHGGPMDAVSSATIAELGLVGSADNNRYRPVTLIERDVWSALTHSVGSSAPPEERRANLMISGLSLAESRGRMLQIGGVRLRIAGETKPCEQMEDVAPGLQAAMRANWGGGGFAKVVTEGTINVGDAVAWVSDTDDVSATQTSA